VQAHDVHHIIHDIGCPRHVTHILQQGESRKENHQDGQERQNGSNPANDAIHHHPTQPEGRPCQVIPCPPSQWSNCVFIQPLLQRAANREG